MANVLYPKFKGALGQALVDFADSGIDVRAILIDSAAYTYNATHEFLSSVAGGARVAVSPALVNLAWDAALATLDSDDPIFAAVAGASIEAVILYIHTGSDATARLIGYWDTGITGAPVTPSGADLQIFVPAGGWFAL